MNQTPPLQGPERFQASRAFAKNRPRLRPTTCHLTPATFPSAAHDRNPQATIRPRRRQVVRRLGVRRLFQSRMRRVEGSLRHYDPPPNVTGVLHMGHLLKQHDTGHPHPPRAPGRQSRPVAPRHRPRGIATQTRVEKDLRATEKKTRHDLAAKSSSSAPRSGATNTATSSSTSSRNSAPRATGRAKSIRSTPTTRRPCCSRSSPCTSAATSTAANAW